MSEKEKKELEVNPDANDIIDDEDVDLDMDLDEEDVDVDELAEKSEEKATGKTAKAAKSAAPAKSAAKKAKPPEKKKSGNRLVRFFKDMRVELKKVAWPTKKQTVNNTGIVIGVVLVAGAFVWIFDGIAGSLITALINLAGSFFGA